MPLSPDDTTKTGGKSCRRKTPAPKVRRNASKIRFVRLVFFSHPEKCIRLHPQYAVFLLKKQNFSPR